MKLELGRRLDHIKILESNSVTASKQPAGYQCFNCKERYQLIPKPGDPNNYLFCMNCGHSTPTRSIKRSRSLIGGGNILENDNLLR